MSEAPAAPAATEAPASAAAPPAASVAEVLFPAGEVSPPVAEPAAEPSAEGASSTPSAKPEAAVSEAPKEGEPPAEVEYDLSAPEGFELDETLTASAKTALREAGVAPDKVAPLIKVYSDAITAAAAKAQASFDAQQAEWASAIEAMPEFQGQTKEKSLQSIGRLIDNYGTPEVKEALNMYSIGNNPALVKFILSVAQALDEGAPAAAGGVAPNGKDGKSLAGRSLGQVLLPDHPQT